MISAVTGDDGCELLEVVENHFNALLHSEEHGYRKVFGLENDEYLFHPEGDFMLPLYESSRITTLFNSASLGRENVRAFTVGELHQAICTQKQAGLEDFPRSAS